ncbi:MAG: CAP domain-containing protein [Candidatus Dormiibacterota bacterium]
MLGSKLAATCRLCLALLLSALIQPAAVSAGAADTAGVEAQLFALLNQDRASAGLPPLSLNSTMSAIARDATVSICPGQAVHGRAKDMVERNYFSHQVQPCNATVMGAVASAGVPMQPGGEIIGFNNQPLSQAAARVNQDWLNSPSHRDGIMGAFRQVGIGAWSAPGTWSGAGRPVNGTIVFSAIFTGSTALGTLPKQPGSQRSATAPKSGGSAGSAATDPRTRTEPATPAYQAPVVAESGRAALAINLVLNGALPSSGFIAGAGFGFLGCLALAWRRRRLRVPARGVRRLRG